MKCYALIGRGLEHSYSKEYFTALFQREGLTDHSYELCNMSSLEGLRQWAEGYDGFNVTHPYKCQVVDLLDGLSPEAEAIGAVNCVVHERSTGRLIGYNTDAPAFGQTLVERCKEGGVEGLASALVLGRGGAARAVAYALQKLGIECRLTDRTGQAYAMTGNRLQTSEHLPHYQLLVNATPVGMYPHGEDCPWRGNLPKGCKLVYDLVYNPSPTRLMRLAEAQGIANMGGLPMLHRQAELGWQLWS